MVSTEPGNIDKSWQCTSSLDAEAMNEAMMLGAPSSGHVEISMWAGKLLIDVSEGHTGVQGNGTMA